MKRGCLSLLGPQKLTSSDGGGLSWVPCHPRIINASPVEYYIVYYNIISVHLLCCPIHKLILNETPIDKTRNKIKPGQPSTRMS